MRLKRNQLYNPQINPVHYFNRGFPEPLNHHVSYNRGMNHFVPQPPQNNLFVQQQQQPQQQSLFSNQMNQSNLFSNQSNPFSNQMNHSKPSNTNLFQNKKSQAPSNIFGGIKKVPAQNNQNIFGNGSSNNQVFYSRSPYY